LLLQKIGGGKPVYRAKKRKKKRGKAEFTLRLEGGFSILYSGGGKKKKETKRIPNRSVRDKGKDYKGGESEYCEKYSYKTEKREKIKRTGKKKREKKGGGGNIFTLDCFLGSVH